MTVYHIVTFILLSLSLIVFRGLELVILSWEMWVLAIAESDQPMLHPLSRMLDDHVMCVCEVKDQAQPKARHMVQPLS